MNEKTNDGYKISNIANNRLIEIGIRYIKLRDKRKIRIIRSMAVNK